MPRDIRALGRLLQKKRKALGFTTSYVAERAELNKSTILRIERGEIAEPRPGLLAQLANILGLSTVEVYDLAGYMLPDDLPSIPVYLRTKYGKTIPASAIKELNDHFKKLEDKYGFNGSEPKDGEDEK